MDIFRMYDNEEVCFMAAETSLLVENTGPKKLLLYANKNELDEKTKSAFIEIGKFAHEKSTRIPWEKNDILIINNRKVMHSRDEYKGSRKILVTLVK
jgi:hypothetical protein